MKKQKTERKSHCSICGKRLSEKTVSGAILWHPGNVEDSGMYCESCNPPKKNNKGRKPARQDAIAMHEH